MLLWETIIETSDTTLVVTEWAMYELSKDPRRQAISERKYHFFSLLLVFPILKIIKTNLYSLKNS